jgi:hypothetical protein
MKDPAILFYTSDFITGTLTMTDEQVGKYIRLLCLQHQKGRLTEKDMLFICKSYDEDIFCKFIQNGDKKYFNERLESEIKRRLKYSESRSNNRKGSQKKEEKNSDISLSYDYHMETETITVNENINEVEKPEKNDKINFQNTIEYWNKKTQLSKIEKLTESRKRTINARVKEHGKDALKKVIDKTIASKFLNGENDKQWTASFDWIMLPTNFIKVLEGNYDNKEQKSNKLTVESVNWER